MNDEPVYRVTGTRFKTSGVMRRETYPGDFLLLVFLDSQEAGAVDGHHHLLKCSQQISLVLPLTVRTHR